MAGWSKRDNCFFFSRDWSNKFLEFSASMKVKERSYEIQFKTWEEQRDAENKISGNRRLPETETASRLKSSLPSSLQYSSTRKGCLKLAHGNTNLEVPFHLSQGSIL